jgi:hypothetical protein
MTTDRKVTEVASRALNVLIKKGYMLRALWRLFNKGQRY